MSKVGNEELKLKKLSAGMELDLKKSIGNSYETPTGDEIPESLVKDSKSENQAYFERMIEHSRNKNLALQLKSSKTLKGGDWKKYAKNTKKPFVQKLAASRDTIKARRAENAQIDKAKEIFQNAGYCTVREKAALEEYFKSWGGKGDPGIGGVDEIDDPALTAYITSILTKELNNASFTDDYLSDHIVDMFEYTRKLRHFANLKERFPKFFSHLSDEKKALLESRASLAVRLGEILKKHMYLHGIELERTNEGFSVKLRKEEPVDKTTLKRRRKALRENYDADLKAFVDGIVTEEEVNLAKIYVKDKNFSAEEASANLDKHIAGFKEANEACGEEMKTAADEIKRAYKVRQKFIEKQSELLGSFTNARTDEEKARIRSNIARNNKKIRLANLHVERYRSYIDFCTGRINMITDSTAQFLADENHPELMELVHLRLLGNCLEQGFVGSARIESAKKKEKDVGGFETPLDEEEEAAQKYAKEHPEEVKKKEIEDYIKDTADVRMSLDEFYKKAKKYKERKKQTDKFYALRQEGKNIREKATKRAQIYAETNSLKGTGQKTDRFMEIFEYPFMEDYRKRKIITNGGDNDYDLLAVFSGYEPVEGTSEKTRNEVINAVMPLIEEFMSLTPEKLVSMKCPKNPDIESREFWHNRAILYAGQDMQNFLQRIRDWNIPLTDEQYAHLVAIGKVSELLINDYRGFSDLMRDPMTVVTEDERLKGESLKKINDNVFEPLYGDSDLEDEAVNERMNRFAGEQAGLKILVPLSNGRKMGKYTPVEELSVLETMGLYVTSLYTTEHVKNDAKQENDPFKLYELKKKETLKDKDAFAREKERILGFYPNVTDAQVRDSLICKNEVKATATFFNKDQEASWKLAFGDNSGGSADLRSFKILMYQLHPVEYDINGSLTAESRKNMMLIKRDFEDYISGDEKRRNRVLRSIGKEIANIELTDEMLTFEYMKENPDKMHRILKLIHGFQNTGKDFSDFFESDAFTEEERIRIRRNNTLLAPVVSAYGVMAGAYGVDDTKKDAEILIRDDIKKLDKKGRQEWGRQQEEMLTTVGRSIFEGDDKAGVAGTIAMQKKRDALYETNADEIDRALIFNAKAVAESAYHDRALMILNAKASVMPESEKKRVMKAELEKKEAAFEELKKASKDKVKLSEDIVKFVYGEISELSEEAKKLYEEEVKNTKKPVFVHVEVAPEVELKLNDPVIRTVKAEKTDKENADDALSKKAKNVALDAINSALSELDNEEEEQADEIRTDEIRTDEIKTDEITDTKSEEDFRIGENFINVESEETLLKAEKVAANLEFPPYPEYKVSTPLVTPYEQQGTFNCWCCSGAALFNKFVEQQDGKVKKPIVQKDVRGYVPGKGEMKTLKEIEALGLEYDENMFKEDRNRMLNYMGKDKTEFGNLFEVADFFMKKRTDFEMNRMLINLPALVSADRSNPKTEKDMENDAVKHYNQKVAFLNTVNKVLGTKNLVSMYIHDEKHYVTICGLDGENVTYWDSSPLSQKTVSVDKLLKRGVDGRPVELTWFSKLRDKKELLEDYKGKLTVDEKTGEYKVTHHSMEEAVNQAHTKGVLIGKSGAELGENMEGIELATYIPKFGNVKKSGKTKQNENRINEEPVNEKKTASKKYPAPIIAEQSKAAKSKVYKLSDKKTLSARTARMDQIYHQRDEMISDTVQNRPLKWQKDRHALTSDLGRNSKQQASCLTYFLGDTPEQSWEYYSAMQVHTEKATPEQKRAKTIAYEHLFEAILKFDISRMTVNNIGDILSDKCFDASVMCMMCFDTHPGHFKEYEELIKDKDAGCALTKEQLDEVYEKWLFFHECGVWFQKFPETAAHKECTDAVIKDVMEIKDPEKIMAKGARLKSKEKNDVYNTFAVFMMQDQMCGFRIGDDAVKAYEKRRADKKMTVDHRADALKAIRDRAEKEGFGPKDPNDHDMSAEEAKELKQYNEDSAKRYEEKKRKQEEERNKRKKK